MSTILLWMIALFTLILCLALVRSERTAHRSPHGGGLKPGALAPDFTAQTSSGEICRLSDYRGRKIVFLFFRSHCQPCRELITSLARMSVNTHRLACSLVLVSGDEEQKEAAALLEEIGLPVPLLFAPHTRNTFFADYLVSGTPSYCFVNPDGTVHASGLPLMSSGTWQMLLDWIGEEARDPEQTKEVKSFPRVALTNETRVSFVPEGKEIHR